jgi:hypothetical protein
MRTRLLIALALVGALAAPASGLASHGGGKAKSSAHSQQVTYKLEGTLSSFTAVKGATPGSITIHVTGGNRRGRAFVGDMLTFRLTTATKVEPNDNGTIADGDRGEVKVKGPAGLDVAGIQKLIPRKVEDEAQDEDEDEGEHGDHDGHGDHGDHGGRGRD